MRPDLQEEGLVDRETVSSGFHERSTALHVAQSHAHPRHLFPRPARHGRRRQRLRARGQPTEPLGRCVVSSSRVRIFLKYARQQRRFSCEASLCTLSYSLTRSGKGGAQLSE